MASRHDGHLTNPSAPHVVQYPVAFRIALKADGVPAPTDHCNREARRHEANLAQLPVGRPLPAWSSCGGAGGFGESRFPREHELPDR
jgi:hypothetical protein